MNYAITRGEILILMAAIELPERLRDIFVKADILLSAATEFQTVYRLNTAMFISVPDLRLLELYIGLKRFSARYDKAKELESTELDAMVDAYYTEFMDGMRRYLK